MCNLSKGVEEKGIEKGLKQGIKQGIYGAISMCRDLNLPEEIIFQKLQQKFHLSEEAVNEMMA